MQFWGEPLTKYMYHELFLRSLQGQFTMWTGHELPTLISSSASVPVSLASCCRSVHTRPCLLVALESQSTGVEVALQPGEGAAAPRTQLKWEKTHLAVLIRELGVERKGQGGKIVTGLSYI